MPGAPLQVLQPYFETVQQPAPIFPDCFLKDFVGGRSPGQIQNKKLYLGRFTNCEVFE
jgi:hypothetical protein